MKARRVLDILGGALCVGFLGFYIYRHYIAPPPKKRAPRTTLVKANDILKYKTVISSVMLNTTATSSACTVFLKSTAEKTMNDFANEFVDHNLDEIVKTCVGAFPTRLQTLFGDVLVKCKTSTREKIESICYSALMSAKTASVATIIRPDVDPKKLDATILLQLLAEKFANGDFFEHPERSLEFLDALLDKEPSYLSGYKMKLMLLSMSSLNKEEHNKDAFLDTLDEAMRLNPKDADLREMALAENGNIFRQSDEPNAGKKDNSEFLEYIREQQVKYPKEWIYDYYKATALYDNGRGNYNETLATLVTALKKAPTNRRILQTIENLKSDDEIKRKHPFSISFGFSLDDL